MESLKCVAIIISVHFTELAQAILPEIILCFLCLYSALFYIKSALKILLILVEPVGN